MVDQLFRCKCVERRLPASFLASHLHQNNKIRVEQDRYSSRCLRKPMYLRPFESISLHPLSFLLQVLFLACQLLNFFFFPQHFFLTQNHICVSTFYLFVYCFYHGLSYRHCIKIFLAQNASPKTVINNF